MSKAKKFNTSKKQVLLNTVNSTQSIFDGTNYEFNQTAKQSEFDKLYKGKPSHLDQVSVVKEYDKPNPSRKQSKLDEKRNFINDIEEVFLIDQKRTQNRSVFEKQKARDNIFPVVRRASASRSDDVERKDMALILAEDFAKRENLILVGDKV